VEVDETFIGGEEQGLRGGRQRGKKVLTGIAVEVFEPKGIGRGRMAVLADASAESLHPFVTGAVEPGSRVVTDGWNGYYGLAGQGYALERRSQRAARAHGDDPGELLPAVHRVASLCKRWLLGTHQGSVERRSPAGLPERVRLPVQPPPLPQLMTSARMCAPSVPHRCSRPARSQVQQQVPRLLGGPRPVRVGGHAQDMDVAGADLDDEEHVQAAQRHLAVDMEEVAHQHGLCLGAQELPPGIVAASRPNTRSTVATGYRHPQVSPESGRVGCRG